MGVPHGRGTVGDAAVGGYGAPISDDRPALGGACACGRCTVRAASIPVASPPEDS
jgi:hypothetical protein